MDPYSAKFVVWKCRYEDKGAMTAGTGEPQTSKMPRHGLDRLRTKIGLSLLFAVFGLVLASALFEALVRRRERNRTTVPGSITMLYYQHRRLNHALVRNTDYFGWMRIDRNGFRGRDVSVEKPPGTFRIMAVGASTTFDTQVSSDERTWTARLEYWLNRSDLERRVQVINTGVPGYELIEHLIRLQTDLYRFQPDLIVLYGGHNDISCALRHDRTPPRARANRPNAIPVVTPWRHWLRTHSLLYNKFGSRWIAMRAAPDEPNTDDRIEVPRCGPDQFERDLSAFLAVAKQLDVQVVVPQVVHVSGVDVTIEPDSALRTHWERLRPYADPDAGLALYVEYSAVARRVAEEFGVAFIETSAFQLRGAHLYGRADPVHFNDDGAEQMARHLADALLRIGVVPLPREVDRAR